MSHGHQIAKITFGSFSPPKVAGTNIWNTALEPPEVESEDSQENVLYVHQPEPKNFKPSNKSSKLRRQLFDDDVNYQDRSSKLYSKLVDIKMQQKETLKLLDQLSKADQEFGRKINQNKELLQKEKQSKITDEELKKPLFDELKIKKKDRAVEEILKRMWDNFEPDERVKKMMELEKKTHKISRRSCKWRPVVTVPEPFEMTVREERKMKEKKPKEAGEAPEEEIFEHRHRAKSAPATTFVPLYDEMNERMKERREVIRENAVNVTMAMQQPFSFDKRDAENKIRKVSEIERIRRDEAKKIKEMSNFKAKPVNMKVLDSKVYDKVEEENLYRKIKGRLRKEELLFTSSLPPRMKNNRQREVERRNERMEKERREMEFSHAPQVTKMPDFEKLHRKEMRRKLMHEITREKREIVQKPFRLSARERSRSSVTSSLSSLDCREKGRPSSVQNYRRYEKAKENPMPTRMSETSRKRMECIRESITRAQKQIDRYKRQDDVRKGCDVTSEKLKSEISYNMAPADGGKKERAERNKKELVKRQKEYKKFLNDVQNRVNKRPLLLTQHNKKSVETEAERRFNEIMKRENSSALRLDDEIIEQTSEVDENFEENEELSNFEIPLVSATVEKKSEISGNNSVISDKKSVALDKNSVVSDKNSVVSDKNSVVSDKNSVVSDKNSIVSDKNSVVSDKNSVVLDKNSVVSDKNSVVSDKNLEMSHETSLFSENSDKISAKSEVKNSLEESSILETEKVEERVEEKEVTEKTEEESVIEEELEKSLTETQLEESSEKLMDLA